MAELFNGMDFGFYENAIKTNEQWLKAIWDLWLKPGRDGTITTRKSKGGIAQHRTN